MRAPEEIGYINEKDGKGQVEGGMRRTGMTKKVSAEFGPAVVW